ncbi:hypothetical protein FJV46_10525 [Arthrobacter agilis]|nr:hypothetical protein B8W74_04755 [Arthrobacter agilis]PPB46563.1 hypothetical protein CI784_07050 [Arthrobacter agilis]TPV23947.1 hypothetical protein FJV46_10525 [Arthrobacter agilis]
MKAKKLRGILWRLGYRDDPERGGGSHLLLRCEGRQDLHWWSHDKHTFAPHTVRNILVVQVGLTIEEAREVLRNG